MSKKKLYIIGIILIILVIIIIKFYIQITTQNSLNNLNIALKNRDMKTAERILLQYYSNSEFLQCADSIIVGVTDEEIINLSDENLKHFLNILKHLESSIYINGNEETRLINTYNRINIYFTIKTIDNEIKNYGYIEIHKNLKQFLYNSDPMISTIAREKMNELEDGVINETLTEAKKYIKNERFSDALNLLSYCYSWGNEEIDSLYLDVKNKVPSEKNKQTYHVITIGTTQSEVLRLCGNPSKVYNTGNVKDKYKRITYDSSWDYNISRDNRFNLLFYKGKVVGISKYYPDMRSFSSASSIWID